MKTLLAGPDGVTPPDGEVDVPDEQAIDLLNAGYAVPVGPVIERAIAEPVEVAVIVDRPKRTTGRRP